MYLLVVVLPVLLVIAALADIITRDDSLVKHLPKMVWILLVLFLPLIGSILWFALGHEYVARTDRGSFGDPRRWGGSPEGNDDSAYGSSGRSKSGGGASARGQFSDRSPRSTEDELAELDREIDFHKNQERIRLLEAEIEERRKNSE
jgi:hypothetical protein